MSKKKPGGAKGFTALGCGLEDSQCAWSVFFKCMPKRFLRPGIRTSPRWNAVSHRAARLYIAILTLADDYGRYDGRPAVLWADAFAIWNEQNPPEDAVSCPQVAADCAQLSAAGLLEFYEVAGRRYLQVIQWDERVRSESKWPDPPPQTADICPQKSAEIRGNPPPSARARVSPSSPSTPSSTPPPAVEPPLGFPKDGNEAVAMADTVGVPPHFARLKYDESVGIGFTNWNGKRITSFSHWIKAEWTRAEHGGTGSNGKTAAPDNFWKNTKELELIEKEIETVRGRATRTATETIYQEKDKPVIKRLAARRSELKTALGLK